MLTGKIVKQVEIPHEPGEWMRFKMLSGKTLERSREVRFSRLAEMYSHVGKREREEVETEPEAEAEAKVETPEERLAGHDVDTVLRAGIAAWSYPDRLTPQAIDELDDATRKWAAAKILTLTDENEADRKNV